MKYSLVVKILMSMRGNLIQVVLWYKDKFCKRLSYRDFIYVSFSLRGHDKIERKCQSSHQNACQFRKKNSAATSVEL